MLEHPAQPPGRLASSGGRISLDERAEKEKFTPPQKKVERALADDTLHFRPSARAETPLLCVVDDGAKDSGEIIRLRKSTYVIGRNDGDIQIPHDSAISGRHAELVLKRDGDRNRWLLRDLGSTNGTYVRVQRCKLRGGREFMLGSRRYAFSEPAARNIADEDSEEDGAPIKTTRGWRAVSPAEIARSACCVVEVTSAGEGASFPLLKDKQTLGRDPSCDIAISDDPFLSPRHAHVSRDASGSWFIENADSLNGLWVRVSEVRLETTAAFQLGEQRFLFRVS